MLHHENFKPLLESKTNVFGSDGEKIGTLGQIYLDDGTDLPHFATVNTGLFGSKENFVPLTDAEISNGNLYVKYPKHFVKDAPDIGPTGHLSPEDEDRLFEYYSQAGLGWGHAAGAGQAEPELAREHRDPSTSRIRRYDGADATLREETGRDPGRETGPRSSGDAELQGTGDNARNEKARVQQEQLAEGPRAPTEEGPEARGPGPLHRLDP